MGIGHLGQTTDRIKVVAECPQDRGSGRSGLPPGLAGHAVEVVITPLGQPATGRHQRRLTPLAAPAQPENRTQGQTPAKPPIGFCDMSVFRQILLFK